MRTTTQATTDEQTMTKQAADDLRDQHGVVAAIENTLPGTGTGFIRATEGIDSLVSGDEFVTDVGAPIRVVYTSVFADDPVEFDGYIAYVSTRRVGGGPDDLVVTGYAATDRHPSEFNTRDEFETSDVVSWRVIESNGRVNTVRDDGTEAHIGTHNRTSLAPTPTSGSWAGVAEENGGDA